MMIDMLLVDPTLTNEEIGVTIGLHPLTVATVRRSDMFQLQLRERRQPIEEAVEAATIGKINSKLTRLADTAVDTLQEQLEKERLAMHASVQRGSLETCEMALRAIGLLSPRGNPSPSQSPTPVNVNVIVDASLLGEARAKMRALSNVPTQPPDDGRAELVALPATA